MLQRGSRIDVLRQLARGGGFGASAPAPLSTSGQPIAERRQRVEPAHVLVGLAFGAALFVNAGPLTDIDSFWHVRIGDQILRTGSLAHLGESWLAVQPPHQWATSQWLSEVAMSATVQWFGWGGLVVGRLALVAATLAWLIVGLSRRFSPRATAIVFVASAVSIAGTAQERPQSVSFFFLVPLAFACFDLLTGRRRPPLLAVGVMTLVWAQCHGMWVLAPASFAFVAALALTQNSSVRRSRFTTAVGCAAVSLLGVVNPVGPASLLMPLTFRSATSQIVEWQPTKLWDAYNIGLAAILLMIIVAWARRRDRVPATQIAWFIAWSAFAFTAFRNMTTSTIMLAPLAAAALSHARTLDSRAATSRRERGWLLVATGGLVASGVVASVINVASAPPLSTTHGLRIAAWVASHESPVRIFNAYNASGALIAFGGGKARLVIDGRADLWGDAYIRRITGAEALDAGWQSTLADARPDALVLPKDQPLTTLLVRERTWHEVMQDGPYALLLPGSS